MVASGPGGASAHSNEVSATTAALPAAPTGVTATPLTASRVQVSWDPVAGATGYEVWHSAVSGGPYSRKARLGAASTSFLHTTATPGTTQFYVVRTTGPTGTSANSAEVSATTPALPSPPTGVTATAVGSTRVTVSWDAVPGATSYEVWRSATSGGPYTRLRAVFPTTYTDTAPATTYYYVVRTINPNGISPNSAPATATTP